MVNYNRTGIDAASENSLDEDECDGWGPVRPRRSSAPVPLVADNTDGADDTHDEDQRLRAAKDVAR